MILMYDTASGGFQGGIPDDAPAILFYLDGLYANEQAARARFPHLFAAGRALGLTVLGRTPAAGDDFEPGNWRGNTAQWVTNAIAAGAWRPVVYADETDMYGTVIPQLEAKFGRPLGNPGPGRRFRLLLARPNGDPTIPADMDGVQHWWGSIQGAGKVDMDISAVRDDFFQTTPTQTPTPPEGTVAISTAVNQDGRLEVFVELASGEVKHIAQQQANGEWWKNADGTYNWLSLGNPGK